MFSVTIVDFIQFIQFNGDLKVRLSWNQQMQTTKIPHEQMG